MSDLPHWWEYPEEDEDFLTGIYCGDCGLEIIWLAKEETEYCPRCGQLEREYPANHQIGGGE